MIISTSIRNMSLNLTYKAYNIQLLLYYKLIIKILGITAVTYIIEFLFQKHYIFRLHYNYNLHQRLNWYFFIQIFMILSICDTLEFF